MDAPVQNRELRILLLEDVQSDAELEEGALRDGGLAFTSLRVDTREAFERALDEFKPDVVLADYRLPTYNGREALQHVRQTHPWIPVIMTTGALGDEAAVELLKLGARDYVIKDRLARLAPAVNRALSEEHGIRNRKLAEGKYKALFAEAMDGIVLIDCDTWQVVDCNAEFERQTGRTLEQLKNMRLLDVLPSDQHDFARKVLQQAQKSGTATVAKFKLQKPGGEVTPIESTGKYLSIQRQNFIQGVTRDISERLRAEEALRESEARYKRITEGLTDYQYTVRIENGRAVETIQSPACVTVTGYTAEEFAADPNLWIQMIVPEDRVQVTQRLKEAISGKDVPPIEHRIIRKDGALRWVSDTIILFKDAAGKLLSYDGVIRDITERKRAEQVIQDEKAFSESLIQSLPDVFFVADQQGNILQGGRRGAELLGVPLEQLRGTSVLAYVHEEDRPLMTRKIQDAFATGAVEAEARLLMKTGVRNYLLSGTRVETLRGVNVIGLGVDITDRKRTEDELRRVNRALRTLSAANLALVRAKTEEELLRTATGVIVEHGGYRLAVVDYAEHDRDKNIKPMAWSGTAETDYWAQHLTWADSERGQLPVAKAIRSGKTQICRDIASDPGFKPWREVALAHGYVSNIALPLTSTRGTFGGVNIFASEARAFDEEEVRLLEELADDLAYGIVTLRTRTEHEMQATVLRQSLEQSIQTIAATVEARDPYTAGHQRRVGDLAAAIAKTLGLSEEQVNGIHLAAIIHDLGKIHIPAEILSKPGKLNDIEFMLIKTHPQAGYDIVKDVKFPWRIADMILQHHERLDGSGYPKGLKGDEILFEARILTVADVVEAMSSHRPYRPTLGVVAALSEIDRGRGIIYDAAVADACMKLFTQEGFRFSG